MYDVIEKWMGNGDSMDEFEVFQTLVHYSCFRIYAPKQLLRYYSKALYKLMRFHLLIFQFHGMGRL